MIVGDGVPERVAATLVAEVVRAAALYRYHARPCTLTVRASCDADALRYQAAAERLGRALEAWERADPHAAMNLYAEEAP